jgi:hypothetical protein
VETNKTIVKLLEKEINEIRDKYPTHHPAFVDGIIKGLNTSIEIIENPYNNT